MPTILFICTANRFRSPLAAHYFQQQIGEKGLLRDLTVMSAGTWANNGQQATYEAKQLAEAASINLKHHRSVEVTESLLLESDLILVMETGHKEALSSEFPEVKDRIFLLSKAAVGIPFDIPDPYMTDEAADRIARDIFELLDTGHERIVDLANRLSRERLKP